MPMRERCLWIEERYGIKISRTHLQNIYKAHGIGRRRPSFKFTTKRSEAELKRMIREYVKDLIYYMRAGK